MLPAEMPVENLSLEARLVEFRGVLGTIQITDASGGVQAIEQAMGRLLMLLKDLRAKGRSVFVIGNGGSDAVASHAVTDFINVGKLRATTLHDASTLTCMTNDYGYEFAFSRILSTLAHPGDMLIAISSSGQSQNIRNAAIAMKQCGGTIITLSGFAPDNPLRALGDFNVWLKSRDYGFVEIGHQFVLHNLADRLRLGL